MKLELSLDELFHRADQTGAEVRQDIGDSSVSGSVLSQVERMLPSC